MKDDGGPELDDDQLKQLAHDEMMDYVDMGCFKDWKFAHQLLKEGFFFGYKKALLAERAKVQ